MTGEVLQQWKDAAKERGRKFIGSEIWIFIREVERLQSELTAARAVVEAARELSGDHWFAAYDAAKEGK